MLVFTLEVTVVAVTVLQYLILLYDSSNYKVCYYISSTSNLALWWLKLNVYAKYNN